MGHVLLYLRLLGPESSPGGLSRAAPRDQAGRLSIHPRFRFGTCLRPPPPSRGPSPFGKSIVCGSRKRVLLLSFCRSRACFRRVSSWHVSSEKHDEPGRAARHCDPVLGGWQAQTEPRRGRLAPMLSLFFFKVIRVPAVVETGTDVPARGNGLISCRPFPPGRLPPSP